MQEHFPCWLYHADHPPRLVKTLEEYEACRVEGGWVDTPARLKGKSKKGAKNRMMRHSPMPAWSDPPPTIRSNP